MKKLIVPMLVAAVLSGCRSVGTVESPQGERPYVGKLLVGTDKSVSLRTERTPFRLGIARYSLVNTPFERGLDIVEAIDCHYMSFIEGSLPRDATDAQIAEYKARLAARGIEVDTLGPCYFGDEKTVESAFAFAKRYGMKMISVVPYETHEKDGKWQNYESDAMLDVLGVLTALAEVGYDGTCHIEYEKDRGDNLVQLAESVGYYRGIMEAVGAKVTSCAH